MAENLVAKGFAVLGFDAAGVSLAGAEAAASLAELAARAPTIILMLPDSRAVAEAMAAVLPALGAGALVVDMGSSDPAETRRWAVALAARGAGMLDAPVSGSVPKARAGTLAIMVGGAERDVARAMPIFAAMGETILPTGPVGSAHAMKALNNYVYAAGLLAVSEAALIAERQGLDLEVLAQVLNASSGRNVASETKLAQEIIPARYAGGFQLGLMRKDLETAGAMGEAAGTPRALLELCRGLWAEAVAAEGPKSDNTAIHRHLKGRG